MLSTQSNSHGDFWTKLFNKIYINLLKQFDNSSASIEAGIDILKGMN